MSRAWQLVGTFAYYLTWPALFIFFLPSQRTRVVLCKDQQILCQKGWYSNGRWLLPGGGLHRGEDVIPGAIREVFEETGIRLDPSAVRVLGSFWTSRGFRFRYHVLECDTWDDSTFRPGIGMYETSWVDISTLLRPSIAEESARASVEHFTKSPKFGTLDRGK